MTLIQNLEELTRAWIKLARGQSRLFVLEAKLARYSIIPFFLAFILLLIMSTCLCLFTLFTIMYGIFLFCHDKLTSILVVELLGIIGFMVALKICRHFFKQMRFTKSRQYMKKQVAKLKTASKEDFSNEQNQQS